MGAGGGAGDASAAGKKAKRRGTTVLRDLTPREMELLAARYGRPHQPRTGRAARHSPGHRWDHLDHLRIKLRVHNRVQLALAAQRLGIARRRVGKSDHVA